MSDESSVEKLFPRIAKQIVTYWGHPEFEKFAEALIIDDRGNRHGLPREVLSDLLFLYNLHSDRLNIQSTFAFSMFQRPKY